MHPRALGVLALGLVCVSTAAVLIRLADAPPLVTATWRLTFASCVLVPVALADARRRPQALAPRDLARALLAGGMLAAHFALWITSLDHTSVASSVVLVTTNPLWVGLAAPFVLGEVPSPPLWLGIALAFVGGAVIGWGDMGLGGSALQGDLLALGGAWAAAAYFLIGRALRARLNLTSYVALVYGAAALILLAASLATRQPLLGHSGATWWYFVALALVPQILGHSSFNWALQHISATMVAGTVLGEAIGSTLLAWWILHEPPPRLTVMGGALILIGLLVAAWSESSRGDRPIPAGTGAHTL